MMDVLNGQYGYEESIFLSEIPDYFHCVICTLVLRDPVQILSCGHKMCTVCFERIKAHSAMNSTDLRCPFDRDMINLVDVREDISSKRALGNMVVRCYDHESGCEWTGDLRQLHIHTDQCHFKSQYQQDAKASIAFKELTKRVEECETYLMHKDKEIALLKQHSQEQQQWGEEIQSVKAQVSQLALKNIESGQMQQQQRVENLHLQQGIAEQQQKNEMLERRMSELTQKNKQLEQRLHLQHQQHENLQQQHEQYENGQQLRIEELKNEIEALRKGMASCGNGCSNISVTQNIPVLGDLATVLLVNDKPAVIPMEEITVELHNGRSKDVTISNDTHCVQSVKPAIVIAQMAVVPPGSKVWYEVKCTRTSISSCIRVGWSTSDLPFSQKLDVWLGTDAHSYAFDPFFAYKYNNGKVVWGNKSKGDSCFVGVALDLVKGQIMFSIDGQWTAPMGVAFSDIPFDIKLFPAFNGGTDTSMQYNFGDHEFTFAPPDPTFSKLFDVL